MENQMGRLPGLFSNLGDVSDAFAKKIGDAGLTGGLERLLGVFQKVSDEGAPLAETLGRVLGGALDGLAASIENALEVFNSLPPGMRRRSLSSSA
jgi:phage tail tape-measure protein